VFRSCRRFLLVAAALVLAAPALAQGVGINATGAAADTSAILDLSATNKGLLVPRMTAAQRAAIVLPATGLVVFQTDGTTGLYYNAGTPAAANWQAVGAGAVSAQWTASGANLYFSTGRVAVGTTPTGYRFTVQDTGSVFRVTAVNAGGVMASFGGAGQIQVDAPGVFGGRFALLDNGNLGLGVANPTNKLSFAAALGKKISLYPGATGDVGFAVAGNRLQIYSDNSNADVALGYDAAGTFNERFAFKPTGAMAVNGNAGATGQVLTSNGSGAAATWNAPSAATYNNIYTIESVTHFNVAVSGSETPVPDLVQTVNTAGNAKLDITLFLSTSDVACAFCEDSNVDCSIFVDGVRRKLGAFMAKQGRRVDFTLTHVVPVGPGSHTISAVVHVFSSSSNTVAFGSDPGYAGNSLTVRVIPQ
jgi:hypothetical protein